MFSVLYLICLLNNNNDDDYDDKNSFVFPKSQVLQSQIDYSRIE